jgi:hypothetical protein
MNKPHQHVVNNLNAAYRCAVALDDKGLVITSVNLGGSKPKITIQNEANCAQLKAVARTYTKGAYGPERCMSAIVEGCQVDYMVRGH